MVFLTGVKMSPERVPDPSEYATRLIEWKDYLAASEKAVEVAKREIAYYESLVAVPTFHEVDTFEVEI